jgi:DNA-binding LacI/PurR family transcriptional regulator
MGNRIEDIAKAAGVSTATVSRAVNTPDKVSPKTRQKVEEVISQLGYTPNYFARALMKGHTNSVGLLISVQGARNPAYREIGDTIGQILSRNGIFSYLCDCENSPELEKQYARELIRRNIDALFVIETPSLNTGDNYFVQNKFDCPVILIGRYIEQHIEDQGDAGHSNVYVVRCDQKPGLMAMFNQVKRRLLFPFMLYISAGDTYFYTYTVELFKAWKEKNRLSAKNAWLYTAKEDVNAKEAVRRTYEAAKRILASSFRPRSILAGNDCMAAGILAAARELSIRIPDELTLVGMENTFFSCISVPPFSTIDLRRRDVGKAAAALYLELKNTPETAPEQIHVIPSQYRFVSDYM